MIWLFFKVKWFLYREQKQVRRRFPSFLPFEHALKRAYRFLNPYRICRPYGETPLPVFVQIAEKCRIQPQDVLVEAGCGRGRGAMFLSQVFRCRVTGIDRMPIFIDKANEIAARVDPFLPVTFRCEDMFAADYSQATLIYLYGTCLAEEQVLSLVDRFEQLPLTTRIVTVSYPLTDYSPRFRVMEQFTGKFPWGDGEIFIQELII